MKSSKGVWIGAILIAIAIIAFVEFVKDGAPEQGSTGQQVTRARDASIATPSNQQDDPYRQNRALAVGAVRNAYFAAGCKIFTHDEEVLPLVAHELDALNDEAKTH